MYITKFEFTTENLEALWETYVLGAFIYMDRGKTKKAFLTEFALDMSDYTGFWLVVAKKDLLAFVFSKYEGEILEPHVEFFANQTERNKVEGYKFVLETIRDNKTIKGCLIRSFRNTKNVFDHFVKRGLLEFFQQTQLGIQVEYQYLIKH